jgi:hypothetical protein
MNLPVGILLHEIQGSLKGVPEGTFRVDRALSSSKSISNASKVRVSGCPHKVPIASARSKSGSIKTWRSSARAAGGRARGARGEDAMRGKEVPAEEEG